MAIEFVKTHGLGNDFVLIGPQASRTGDPATLARALCDRRWGVGGDGLILIDPAREPNADLRIRVFNADGSRAETCGNGLRCVALYALEEGWAKGDTVAIETDTGVRIARKVPECAEATFQVGMGSPLLEPERIPMLHAGERAVALPIAGTPFQGTAVSLGNPHLIVFLLDLGRVSLAEWGPRLSGHPLFPRGTNVHFAQILAPDRVRVLTWERGVGPTPACGSGACAVCVAGHLEGRSERCIEVHLPGGVLNVDWTTELTLTGPTQIVFRGRTRT